MTRPWRSCCPRSAGADGRHGHRRETCSGVAAIEPDGLLVREDGTYVRALEVGAVNPLVLEPAEGERVSAAFGQVAARLPDRQSLQFYVQGTPLALDELLAEETHHCEQAAGAAEDIGEHERAQAIRRLGIAQEQSIRTHALTVAPLALRYLVVCPWQPASRVLSFAQPRRALRVKADAHERARRDSLRHCEGVRADLEAMGVPGRLLAGAELLDLLHRRFDPDGGLAGGLPASFMSPHVVAPLIAGEGAEAASDRAQRLAEAICTAPVGLCDRSRIALGETLEEVFYVSLAPEQTWLGWLLHMMQAPRPFVLSVHVQATERYRERMAQKRRYKRIHGVNRGVEQRGTTARPGRTGAGGGGRRAERRAGHERRRGHLPREHLLRAAGARPRRGPGNAEGAVPGHRARGHDGLRRADSARPVRPAAAVAVDAAARPRRRRPPAQVRQPQRRRHLPACAAPRAGARRASRSATRSQGAPWSGWTRSIRRTRIICC